MTIERIGPVAPGNGLPRICRAVVHDKLVYMCGVTPDPTGDVTVQTREVLQRIDQILAAVGTNKSRILSAQAWLAGHAAFPATQRGVE